MPDTPPHPAANGAPLRVVSLDQLLDLCAAEHFSEFTVDGHAVQLPIVRLSPAKTAAIDALEDELFPPIIRGKSPRDEGYPFDAPEYRAYAQKREKLTRTARALTIYAGCPAIRAHKPDLENRDEITEFVFGMKGFTDLMLERIHLDIRKGGLGVVERANFSSGSVATPS